MKNKVLSLAVVVLGTPLLAHAVTYPSPPDGFCLHAQIPQFLIDLALQILGHLC